jgi:hypothetical protein
MFLSKDDLDNPSAFHHDDVKNPQDPFDNMKEPSAWESRVVISSNVLFL